MTLIIMIVEFGRNNITKDDLDNWITSLRLDVNKQFEEVHKRLDEAAADRRRIEETAAAERNRIENAMSAQIAEVKVEITRLNQNYIDHLAHHANNPILFRRRTTALDCERATLT